MLDFMYLIDKELIKTTMAYIDHNRHDHIHNGHISQEAATCLMVVMDLQKIEIIQDAESICSFQPYAFYCLHLLCSYAFADRSPCADHCQALCVTSWFFAPFFARCVRGAHTTSPASDTVQSQKHSWGLSLEKVHLELTRSTVCS